MDFTEVYSDTVCTVSAAARSGSTRQVRRLIQSGRSVDVKDNRGWNSLHEAAAAGTDGCVKEILKAAAALPCGLRSFLNSVTHEGESACFLAAQNGHLSVIKLLLKAKADVNQQTNDLSCPLYAAVDRGHADIVQLLIYVGAEVNRTHTASSWTCLHQAVYKGHSGIVRLLSEVSDLEAVDDHRITPLFVSAQYGKFESLRILIAAGASVNCQTQDGATPLLISSQEGHGACVDLLLENGADPNRSCGYDWPQLPLHAAAQFGHIEILKRLMAVTDRACDCAPGQVSPLFLAVHNNQSEVVEVLLKEGFSPDAQDCEQLLALKSPLSLALLQANNTPRGSLETVKLLLAAGASLHKESWNQVLNSDKADLLRLVLDFRSVPGSSPRGQSSEGRAEAERRELTELEMTELLDECVKCGETGEIWLPLLLSAGLEPDLLLQTDLFKEAPSSVLNLLLEFVNWSCLSPGLKLVLDQRRVEKTWKSLPLFDSVPSLCHLCRIRVRTVLGSAPLMRTTVVQRLPVPVPLHHFLQFRDIQPSVSVDLKDTDNTKPGLSRD